ncbi:SDR family oxidoreductase [Kineosporia sp. NBRC 101731]|uniref:SDR family oxidoreductase n=1 Tax=Kineosporia sp. NBRC 101731 TaxID=3032199 RepID=UPI0024A3B606|nr:SDR family oxidoreductase [Kineosporia sp. NBRC 101731]GLY33126.1 putative NAD-dependent epimerase/dehydratase [Kineosporia sp. NBRC 101731]
MRVFVTGATGFIGSHVARELLAHGHQVLGLTRSDAGAAKLEAAGIEPYRGTIDDPDGLREGALQSDGVIHTAFDHSNLADLPAAAVKDLAVVQALGEELAGKPFVTTYGTTALNPGHLLTEDFLPTPPQARGIVEAHTRQLAEKDVRAVSVRPSTVVHGFGNAGFVSILIGLAREKGMSGYPGDGSSRWPAVHVLDAAVLYRLALEKAPAGSVLHAVQDEGVTVRQIAEAVGRGTGLPVGSVAPEHFGWLGQLMSLDVPASSATTRELTGWTPVQPGLIEDLDAGLPFQG